MPKSAAQLDAEIGRALSQPDAVVVVSEPAPAPASPRAARRGGSTSYGDVEASMLPPPFARSWATAVRAYRRHAAELAAGDQDAWELARKARDRLSKMTNSGEIDRGIAERLYNFVYGHGEGALPALTQAEEAGRRARSAAYDEEARRLRVEERRHQDPHTFEGELRLASSRR